MKLVGELKDRVEKAEDQEEAKKIIKEAGMELTDEEMDQVAGGMKIPDGFGHMK
ncbi:MAG: hypothetical protein K6E90_03130 [Lachnospiraceae bacterium]|nr:hypothetical protein [Lachnospiraceae bacterium]